MSRHDFVVIEKVKRVVSSVRTISYVSYTHLVAFGKMISFCEHLLNKGSRRGLKGAFVAIVLVLAVYFAAYYLFHWIASFSPGLLLALQILTIFFCLAGTTLILSLIHI